MKNAAYGHIWSQQFYSCFRLDSQPVLHMNQDVPREVPREVAPDKESLAQKRDRLLAENPGYCTASTAAKLIGTSRWGVKHHAPKIEHIMVEGIILYHTNSVILYADTVKKATQFPASISVRGANVERLMKICERYYRTEYDAAPKHLLALAKKIAGI